MNNYARECYLKYGADIWTESAFRTDKSSGGTDTAKMNNRYLYEIRRGLFNQFIKQGLFELKENFYLSDYGTYVDTYTYQFGPDQKNVFAVDITDIPRQIMRSMADYIKAVSSNNLKRVSKRGKPYTLTLTGILNSKLLNNRHGYAYCAVAGHEFKDYKQFDRDLAKFGRYLKDKAFTLNGCELMPDDGAAKYDNSVMETLANFSDRDYESLSLIITRARGFREYIDEIKRAYLSRLTEPIIVYDNGAVNIDSSQFLDAAEENAVIENERYENLENCLEWLNL